MIKIFLVEDEVFALHALERKIEDLKGPYEIVGTAFNGEEALARLEEVPADIVMTDIRMPDMDGITLIETLKERDQKILPVIVSGYQEFDYAQRAVRLGVKDYLLKPVKVAELEKCLSHCVEQLMEQAKKENAVSFMIGEDSFRMNVLSESTSFVVVYVIIANALNHVENILHPSVPYISGAKMEDIFASIFPEKTKISCFDGFFSNEKVLMFSGNWWREERFPSFLDQAAKKLERQTGSFISIYYDKAENYQVLSSTILSCRKKLISSSIFGVTKVYNTPALPSEPDSGLKKNAELFSMLLRQKQLPLLHSNVRRMFDVWKQSSRTAMAVQNDLIFLLDMMRQDMSQPGATSSAFFIENIVCFSANPDELAENFYQLLVELLTVHQKTERVVSAKEFVRQIELYFRQHLDESISLQELSDEMNVSKVYLCRVFKKYMNTTPMDYFTHLRLERAKELLLQFPDMPLREISERVGFSNLYYFSKVFKRITGSTPSEFRTRRQ